MIYTFYSYKGGVGRTMALVNIAELFYRAGLKVLMVDWDIEAPGLERFFPSKTREILGHPGLMDMLEEYKRRAAQPVGKESQVQAPLLPLEGIANYLVDIYPQDRRHGTLWLLPAGKRDGEHFSRYAHLIRTFDWLDFYKNWEGELFFEWLRQEGEKLADVVLIDSRTGVTEIGGICTYQLADVVVMFCAPHRQSLEGTLEMVRNFMDPRVKQLRKDHPLAVLVVPARVEDRAEKRDLEEFEKRFVTAFGHYIPEPLPRSDEFLWALKIPHIPYYAFEERVAVREGEGKGSDPMRTAFEQLASVLVGLAPEDSALRKSKYGSTFKEIMELFLGEESAFPIVQEAVLTQRAFKTFKVFVASPGDVLREREIVHEVIEEVNRILRGMEKPFRLDVYAWDRHVHPDIGLPQRVILRQIPIEQCDIFIGTFWKRFGTPPGTKRPRDGKPYLSGTEQEIDEAIEARKNSVNGRPIIILYRKVDPLPDGMTDEDYLQYAKVIEYFRQCEPDGAHPALVIRFEGEQFKPLLLDHLLRAASRLEEDDRRRAGVPPVVPIALEPGIETDTQTKWLRSVRLRDNPFRYYLAQYEQEDLPFCFVPLGELRVQNLINEEMPWVIYADAGCGKTALRIVTAARCSEIPTRIFCVLSTTLNTWNALWSRLEALLMTLSQFTMFGPLCGRRLA